MLQRTTICKEGRIEIDPKVMSVWRNNRYRLDRKLNNNPTFDDVYVMIFKTTSISAQTILPTRLNEYLITRY